MMLSLSEIICTKLIPWSAEAVSEHFIIARRKMRQADMPQGAQLIPHKIQSKRVIFKQRRSYDKVRNISAVWPDAGLHELQKYMLVCVLEGHVDYALGHYKVKCGPGHFIFIPPGIPRPDGSLPYVDLERSASCEIAVFLLHPNALECWISHGYAQGREHINNCLVLHEHVISFFHALMEEVFSEEPNSLQVSEKLLSVIFEVLQREIEAGRFQPVRSHNQAKQKEINASGADFVTHLERYVQTNLQKPLRLDTVSAAMYFSSTHFTRLMRRETGKSFNEYLAELRLVEAKKLLQDSQWSISAIASFVGFRSTSYFCTFFKRHVHVTPSKFRAEAVKKANQS